MAENEGPNPEQTTDERRLHLVMFEYWRSLLAGRQFPKLSELNPHLTSEIRDYCFLLEFPGKPENALLRFVGKKLEAEHEGDEELRGKRIAELVEYSIIKRLADRFREVRSERVPIGFEAEYDRAQGYTRAYRGILLPFSENGEDIHSIYGVINWVDRDAGRQDVRLEPVAPERVPDEADEDFRAILEAGQEEARKLPHSHTTARQHLYRTLSRALELFEIAQEAPQAYRQRLVELGIRSQDRAPYTPALKLIFGKDYDKTRITEYAAALAHAQANGIDSRSLETFLAGYRGGIKGCVLAERQARRHKRGSPLQRRMQRIRKQLLARHPSAIVKFDVEVPESAADNDFVLLLARRGSNRETLEILDVLPQQKSGIEAALRQISQGRAE
ncbi:MAG: PAS domain-containing protein [Proteobacteria bacterium]|nr:PAS domain-containing protein [Pseudomonadota bacterium]